MSDLKLNRSGSMVIFPTFKILLEVMASIGCFYFLDIDCKLLNLKDVMKASEGKHFSSNSDER